MAITYLVGYLTNPKQESTFSSKTLIESIKDDSNRLNRIQELTQKPGTLIADQKEDLAVSNPNALAPRGWFSWRRAAPQPIVAGRVSFPTEETQLEGVCKSINNVLNSVALNQESLSFIIPAANDADELKRYNDELEILKGRIYLFGDFEHGMIGDVLKIDVSAKEALKTEKTNIFNNLADATSRLESNIEKINARILALQNPVIPPPPPPPPQLLPQHPIAQIIEHNLQQFPQPLPPPPPPITTTTQNNPPARSQLLSQIQNGIELKSVKKEKEPEEDVQVVQEPNQPSGPNPLALILEQRLQQYSFEDERSQYETDHDWDDEDLFTESQPIVQQPKKEVKEEKPEQISTAPDGYNRLPRPEMPVMPKKRAFSEEPNRHMTEVAKKKTPAWQKWDQESQRIEDEHSKAMSAYEKAMVEYNTKVKEYNADVGQYRIERAAETTANTFVVGAEFSLNDSIIARRRLLTGGRP